MKTKIILAGGSGFLGHVLANCFAARGMEILILTRNPKPRADAIHPVRWDGTIRKVCRAPFGLPASRWMLEIGAFFLRTETELLIKSRRVVPGKLPANG